MTLQRPKNFSWIIENELAAMGWPNSPAHLRFLIDCGIRHLITLSPEKKPPVHAFPEINWVEIKIREFFAPSISQICKFISVCEIALSKQEPVGVHCWMGRGRTGVMLACYMVYFQGMSPERAIDRIRLLRPGSIETYEQERIVVAYNDYLCSIK